VARSRPARISAIDVPVTTSTMVARSDMDGSPDTKKASSAGTEEAGNLRSIAKTRQRTRTPSVVELNHHRYDQAVGANAGTKEGTRVIELRGD
jgi:hypothetical protein